MPSSVEASTALETDVLILAGSLYLISTAAFSLLALAIGIRLILLSRRTGGVPERWLGLSIMLCAGIGYGILIAATLGRQAAGWDEAPEFYAWWIAIGWVVHNIGVMFMIDFVRRVFRPGNRAAWALECFMIGVLWVGWIGFAVTGGLTSPVRNGSYWVFFSVIGTYPLWMAIEALRYWFMMQRRVKLALADPLVANRFLLWAIASFCGLACIWVVEIPSILGYNRLSDEAQPLIAKSMIVTAIIGIVMIFTYWLTFFPPAWYRRRFARHEPLGSNRSDESSTNGRR